MARKKKFTPPDYPADWRVETHFVWNRRHIEVGTELKVTGIRGRVRFVKHVRTPTAEWIDVIDRDKHFRSVKPERIRTVHRIKKTRENVG
jgi:hypothetical protein